MKWWLKFVQALRNSVKCTQSKEDGELLESLGYAISLVPSDNPMFLVTMLVWDKSGHETNIA